MDGVVVHWEKSFLKEAYDTCREKKLELDVFTECLALERSANGRVKWNAWTPTAFTNNIIEGLVYANARVCWEGHYSMGPFFKWLWEQDPHAKADEKRGYLYILKQPNRFGMGKRFAWEAEESIE